MAEPNFHSLEQLPPTLREEAEKIIAAALVAGFKRTGTGMLACTDLQLFHLVACVANEAMQQVGYIGEGGKLEG